METKRVAIEQLSGAALQYAIDEAVKGLIMDCRVRSQNEYRAVVAAHNPSGYVEVPVELLEPK